MDYAPYGWLFPRMAALVHHGGSGTNGFGLWAGVPAVVVPFLFDQFYWGRRLEVLGVGLPPLPQKELSAGKLTGAMARVATDGEMRQRARALGKRPRKEDGIGRAVEIVEAVM